MLLIQSNDRTCLISFDNPYEKGKAVFIIGINLQQFGRMKQRCNILQCREHECCLRLTSLLIYILFDCFTCPYYAVLIVILSFTLILIIAYAHLSFPTPIYHIFLIFMMTFEDDESIKMSVILFLFHYLYKYEYECFYIYIIGKNVSCSENFN